MNVDRKRQVTKKQKNGQIIKTLTLKQKVKCYFTKQDDYVSKEGKQQSASSFSFSANKFLSFFVSRLSVEESFVEKGFKAFRKKIEITKKF
jgi:hypothetical protein